MNQPACYRIDKIKTVNSLVEGRLFEYQRPIIRCDGDGDVNGVFLHGRTAFDPSSGRHVRSCHVDLDEFYSRLRVSYRDHDDPRRWMTFLKQ